MSAQITINMNEILTNTVEIKAVLTAVNSTILANSWLFPFRNLSFLPLLVREALEPVQEAQCDPENYPDEFPVCMEGTRKAVITQAENKILDALESSDRFWINGVAGSGKTTLATSIVDKLRSRGVIVATFFCKRDEAERRNPRRILPTLAHQLCLALPQYRKHLAEALSINIQKQIPQPADPAKQLSLFIVDPLLAAGLDNGPVVLLIDALDECDEKPCELLVNALVKTSLPKHCVIVLVSRRLRYLQTKLDPVCSLLVDLDQVLDSPDMASDIYRLLKERLSRIATVYQDSDWPSSRDLSSLTKRAGGLFIWATIVCNFIDQPSYREELSRLLDDAEVAVGIDQLYAHALDIEFAKLHGKTAWVEDYKSVMGVILCSVVPLSATAISLLLGKRENTVKGTLAILQPVLLWGSPVRLAHGSLADYLLSERSEKLWIGPRYLHLSLARGCLLALCSSSLHFNMMGITDSSIRVESLPDIHSRRQGLPEHINYSASHWAQHLNQVGELDDEQKHAIASLVTQFLETTFLFWLETLSLLGAVYRGVHSLKLLHGWLKVQFSLGTWYGADDLTVSRACYAPCCGCVQIFRDIQCSHHKQPGAHLPLCLTFLSQELTLGATLSREI
jgi:hypothetical protein